MEKIKILLICPDGEGGVGFFRSIQPHEQLLRQYSDEFEVTLVRDIDWEKLEYLKKFDLVHMLNLGFKDKDIIHKGLEYCKEHNIVTVLDIDDYWELHPHHPAYHSYRIEEADKITREKFRLYDYVTTTTPIFKDAISKYTQNVHIFPNAINPEDKRFKIFKRPSKRLRVGLIMGAQHYYDVKLLGNISNQLRSLGVLDQVQLVLCGFDMAGVTYLIQPDGTKVKVPTKTEDKVWVKYEKLLTDNYKIIDPQYKNDLTRYLDQTDHIYKEDSPYRRIWTKPISLYYQHYSNVDVLLAPLEEIPFNKMKSQLKAIECAFSGTALIAQNYGPYTIDLTSAIEKGGNINPKGNALLVDSSRNHKDWARYIKKLVNDPRLLNQLQTNLRLSMEDKYDLRNVTVERRNWYHEIVKKAKEQKTTE